MKELIAIIIGSIIAFLLFNVCEELSNKAQRKKLGYGVKFTDDNYIENIQGKKPPKRKTFKEKRQKKKYIEIDMMNR